MWFIHLCNKLECLSLVVGTFALPSLMFASMNAVEGLTLLHKGVNYSWKSFVTLHPGAFTIKLFTNVIHSVPWEARVFKTVIHFHPSLIFADKRNRVEYKVGS